MIVNLKLKVTPENFAEYAEKYTDDPSGRASGGALGWFGKGVMVQPFEETAFSLNKGEISKPVKTQFGYHLIYVIDKRMI